MKHNQAQTRGSPVEEPKSQEGEPERPSLETKTPQTADEGGRMQKQAAAAGGEGG